MLSLSTLLALAAPAALLSLTAASVEDTAPMPDKVHCNSTETRYSCCAHLYNKHIIKFNDTLCLDVEFDPKTTLLDVDMTLDGSDLFEKAYNLTDLSKACVMTPIIHKTAEVCADFDKINITTHGLSACAEIELIAIGHRIAHVDLGCFHFHY